MSPVTSDEILMDLKSMASSTYKKNIIKLGIPQHQCLGVSTPALRSYAKGLKKDQKLAGALWSSGIHEARLLAVLLMDPRKTHLSDIEVMMSSVISWDLCDHICKNLAYPMEDYEELIDCWCNEERLYFKRSAYTLIATAMIHDRQVSEERIQRYLHRILTYSLDNRQHVKKAVLWALREIGKRDEAAQKQAIHCACKLQESKDPSQIWIGKQAQKELVHCVRVKGRKRLIVDTSQMAKEENE